MSGGTFAIGANSETVNGVSLQSGSITGTTGALTSATTYDMQSGTASAILAGAVGLTKTTAGSVTLSGANTYTGATAVNVGTLVAANPAALGGTGSGTTVASGATLNVNGATLNAEPITLNGAGVGGAGALTGTGAAVVSGPVTLASASAIGTTTSADSLTLSGAVSAPTQLTIVGGGDVTATNATNDFSTVQITSAKSVSLVDANALTIGTGVASNFTTLSARAAGGNLTLGGNLTATGAGNAIVLSASANFLNPGLNTLNPGTGRWLVYSTSPAGSTEGGLTAAAGSALPRLYGRTYVGNPPATIAEPGNHLIYSAQPALTVTPNNHVKTYGTNDPVQAYAVSGFITDDGVTDTATTAGLTGSFGRVAGEAVASYLITQGSFASNAGYNVASNFNTPGNTLTVNKATLSGTILNQSKTYGANDPSLAGISVTLATPVNTSVTDWNGTVTAINDTGNVAATLASLTRTVGETVTGSPYSITGGTLNALTGTAAGNYTASLNTTGNTLTISAAPLTATVANQTKIYGADDPALAGITPTLSGLVNRTVTTWDTTVAINDSGNVAATLASLTRVAGETVAGSPYSITGGTRARRCAPVRTWVNPT